MAGQPRPSDETSGTSACLIAVEHCTAVAAALRANRCHSNNPFRSPWETM
jgi:hypothetical protein